MDRLDVELVGAVEAGGPLPAEVLLAFSQQWKPDCDAERCTDSVGLTLVDGPTKSGKLVRYKAICVTDLAFPEAQAQAQARARAFGRLLASQAPKYQLARNYCAYHDLGLQSASTQARQLGALTCPQTAWRVPQVQLAQNYLQTA